MQRNTTTAWVDDVPTAEHATENGPVPITESGEPAGVLLSIGDRRRQSQEPDIVDLLRMDRDIDFKPVALTSLPTVPDLR